MQLRFLSAYTDSNRIHHFVEDEIESDSISAYDLDLLLRFGAVQPVSRADMQALQERASKGKESEKISDPSGLVSANTGSDVELDAIGIGAAAIRRIKAKRPYATLDAVKAESGVPEDQWAKFAPRLSL
jgi:DNA uptake protein ComE-like DNA-binding protein